jgi:hypothetical protein
MTSHNDNLLSAARIAIKDCLGVTRGENIIIFTDDERLPIAKKMAEASVEQDACPIILFFTSEQIQYYADQVPSSICPSLKRVDVVICLYEKAIGKKMFFLRLFSWLRQNVPCRMVAMPGITVDAFCESMGGNFSQMAELAEQLILIFLGSHDMHILTDAGTDLYLSFSSRKFAPESSTGIIKQIYSFGNIPGAEIYAVPLPESVRGCLVVDGSIPGSAVKDPFSVKIERGKVISIDPPSNRHAKELLKSFEMFGEEAKIVGEMGIGLNDAIKDFYGITLIDEKILGTAHVGLGGNAAFGGPNRVGIHIDMVFRNPTIEVDSKMIMKRGTLVFNAQDFQSSYKSISGGISASSLIFKNTNKILIAQKDTFQIFWKGGAGDTHFSTLFDSDTTKVVARIWDKLDVVGKSIDRLEKETKTDREILVKVILLLESEGLVTIKDKDLKSQLP